ncbi:MAG TPA: nucleoside triphosphate pyrophosphohydrolase [Hymenobacter sp.]|jgi:predicted house-cleaning noncanonical NTP pyrophosphatase (MazG superfamily)|uniref:nucleoside triphosphate pyrophosphohydrolase n=1 Tax=Hymenobacter sp. TaxID=1898978 RepID=UPI002ED90FFD
MSLPKLVRDRIPALIAESGRRCATEVLTEVELQQALRAKLVEEAQEILAADPGELPTELADVLEVFEALVEAHGLDPAAIRHVQQARRAERGGFSQRLRLLSIEA